MDKRGINGKATRRRHSETLKRDLVARSLRTGASVSALAQEHGINANLLFNWRRFHLQAQNLDTVVVEPAPAPVPTLLPVTVQPEMQPPATQPLAHPGEQTKAQLAEELGVSPATLSPWIGGTQIPDKTARGMIANLLGLRQFDHVKVRYRGLKKNSTQLRTLFALSNL